MAIISKEQAREIYNYYSQIESSEQLIQDIKVNLSPITFCCQQ